MSFSDIFKKSFLEGYAAAEITPIIIVAALGVAAFFAAYIFFVYRVVTRKTFYSKTFNISLAGIVVITAAIILTVQSSIVISLGMVGALSIVRFRTAIKDPMDLMFLFWSISVGIICGAGLAEIAVVLSIIMTLGIVLLDRMPVARAPKLLIVNANGIATESAILETVKRHTKHFSVKSRKATVQSLDVVIEVRLSAESELLKSVMEIEGVESASLMSHDGEVTF